MIKFLKIISWIWLAFPVIIFLILLAFLKKDVSQLPVAIVGVHDGFCLGSNMCIPGEPISSYQFGYMVGRLIIPQIILIGILLYALYKRSQTAYKISLILFVILLLSKIGHAGIIFPTLIFTILLFTKPVRDYFKKENKEIIKNQD